MKLLGIDASSTRGSVALVEFTDGAHEVLAHLSHSEPNRHAERLMGLVKEVFSSCDWEPSDLDRIAVGVGPGSFTGIRVALALAQGLMTGLGIEGVGVGSLRAIAGAANCADPRQRVVLRDARREEFFFASYGADGEELVAPHAIAQEKAAETVANQLADSEFVVLGTEVEGLPCELGELSGEPDARVVARIGAKLDPQVALVSPHYVRGPNITRPKLPPSPLQLPRS